jgi:hypothetical protein
MTDEETDVFIIRINDGVLYRGPDGREAWVMYTKDQATIVTDINQQGAPLNAVPISKQALLHIISMMEDLP